MTYVVAATEGCAQRLRADQLIILESTTYPGTTLEVVKPILEETSGLVAGQPQCKLGRSPRCAHLDAPQETRYVQIMNICVKTSGWQAHEDRT